MKKAIVVLVLTALAVAGSFSLSGCGLANELGNEMRRGAGLQPTEPRSDWWLKLTGRYGKQEPPSKDDEEAPR